MFSRGIWMSPTIPLEIRKEEKVPMISSFLFSCRGAFLMGSFLVWRVFHLTYKVRHLEMLYYKLIKDVTLLQQKKGGDADDDADISEEMIE